MMITFRNLGETVTGTFNGKPFNAPHSEDLVDQLTQWSNGEGEAPSEEEWEQFLKDARKQVIAGSNEYLKYNPATKEYFLHFEGKTSKYAIPTSLAEKIEESFDKGIDFMPIIKAWARFLENPRLNRKLIELFNNYLSSEFIDRKAAAKLVEEDEISEEAALALCTYQDISITQEGYLATYKVADEVTWEYVVEWDEESESWVQKKNSRYKTTAPVVDPNTGEVLEESKPIKPEFAEDLVFTPAICTNGDKFYSNNILGYVYKVGEMQYLPKDASRNLSNTFGGGGLYTGGLSYVNGYESCGSHLLGVFVNPADILSFQCEGSAMRTDALFPNSIVKGEDKIKLRTIYHSSKYGALLSERTDELIRDAISRGTTVLKENEEANEAKGDDE